MLRDGEVVWIGGGICAMLLERETKKVETFSFDGALLGAGLWTPRSEGNPGRQAGWNCDRLLT